MLRTFGLRSGFFLDHRVSIPLKKTAILMLLLTLFAAPSWAQWIKNPSNGHFYRLTAGRYWGIADDYPNNNQPDWFDAEAEAQSYSPNAHLVTINDQAENDWLVATFDTTERWIGFTDHEDVSSEGVWVWISGEPVTFTKWDGSQPDNGGDGEDCAHLNHKTVSKWGYWNDLGNIYLDWHPDLPLYGIIESPELPQPPLGGAPVMTGAGLFILVMALVLVSIWFIVAKRRRVA